MVQWNALDEALSLESLRPLHEVNLLCVEYLIAAARGDQRSFALEVHLADLLRSLTAGARRRASEFRFLLVDFEFGRAEWWRRVRTTTALPEPGEDGRGDLPREATMSLARSTLMLAWHCVRANRVGTRVLLGISPEVAVELETLRLAEINRIAETHASHLRPRWEDRPALWRQLLIAARDDDAAVMREVTLHWLQLLAGERMAVARSDLVAQRAAVQTRALQ